MIGKIPNNAIYQTTSKWLVELKVHEGLQSLKWEITKKIAGKLIKIFNSLPAYKKGIPKGEEKGHLGCFVYNEKGSFLVACNDYVIGLRKNIIDVKMDGLDIIKNEILRTSPANIYKNISFLFQSFGMEGSKIN